jgi:hypothetical protein
VKKSISSNLLSDTLSATFPKEIVINVLKTKLQSIAEVFYGRDFRFLILSSVAGYGEPCCMKSLERTAMGRLSSKSPSGVCQVRKHILVL